MVVVSGSWVNNVATYPPPAVNNDVISNESMAAKAVLSCRPNSHHFQDRTLVLDQPVKVGRSVARAKPTPANAIFDCKVLSRHHALLWYEDGKFYLQDTKSSNGTFVNNNRLSAETENHELSSGDIVQFGVDVVENNRKVTHGCIIASIKLYLPDGKEAKASPSLLDGERHGMVPLDDLYRLNEIIQEANHREQCLETKLTALQHVVDATRRSAQESWQAYVGEERLLSRVSALETQLQQASKNWGEDRLREEIVKLHDDNEAYQIAAKDALEKLHNERLEAMAMAVEQERARISAQQDALIAKENYEQSQLELEMLARKLTEKQNEAEEQRIKSRQREQDLESKLESESEKLLDLQIKLHELNIFSLQDLQKLVNIQNTAKCHLIYNDDRERKENLLAENDVPTESELNQSNEIIDNHISLTVGPVKEKSEFEQSSEEKPDSDVINNCPLTPPERNEETKRITFKLPDEQQDTEDDDDGPEDDTSEESENDKQDTEKVDYVSDHVDSKTLKYQFQSAQNELKRKIELLESVSHANKLKIAELDKTLEEEVKVSQQRLEESEALKLELVNLQKKWKESCNENQECREKLIHLDNELEEAQEKLKESFENSTMEKSDSHESIPNKTVISNSVVTYDQLVNLEEELVMLKERFAEVSEEKLKMQKDLLSMTEQYNIVCNRTHNKYFFYVAPLVLMVLYLLVSAMIS